VLLHLDLLLLKASKVGNSIVGSLLTRFGGGAGVGNGARVGWSVGELVGRRVGDLVGERVEDFFRRTSWRLFLFSEDDLVILKEARRLGDLAGRKVRDLEVLGTAVWFVEDTFGATAGISA
jgi:hypothetical protein